jgi:O-antigen/teichoic acid export membrane protein
MSGLGKIVRNTSVYGIGLLLTRAIGLFLLPIYTRLLTPADYGILELLDLMTFVLGLVIMSGLQGAVLKYYYAETDPKERREYISTAFEYVSLTGLFVLGIVFLAARPIGALLFHQPGFENFVRITAGTLFCSLIFELALIYTRTKQDAVTATRWTVIKLLISVTFGIILIVGFRYGVWGLLWANLIATGVFAAYAGYRVIAEVGTRFSFTKLKLLLAFGAPIIFNSASLFVLNFSDRFFLQRYDNLAEVGVYGLAYKIGMLVSTFLNVAFGMSWQPHAFEMSGKEGAKQSYARTASLYALAACSFTLVLVIGAEPAVKVMTPPQYWGAVVLVPIIAIAYVVDGLKTIFNTGILIANRPGLVGTLGVVTAVVNVTLNMTLIPRYGARGAAAATFFSFLTLSVLAFVLSQFVHPVRYEYGRLCGLFAGFAAAVALCQWQLTPNLWVNTAFRTGVGLAFFACIWFSRFLDHHEKEQLLQRAGKLLRFNREKATVVAAG